MEKIKSDVTLDAKGLACPMPIVKTKKAMNTLDQGFVLEVEATDPGSEADMKAWAESAGHSYLGTIKENDVLKHYIRKATGEEQAERRHPGVIDNRDLEQLLASGTESIVLDVRESAEFAFGHIPRAFSIPLGELDSRMAELDKNAAIYVVCRSGSRSDLAAQKLSAAGYNHVVNVLPGMSGWKGKTEGIGKQND